MKRSVVTCLLVGGLGLLGTPFAPAADPTQTVESQLRDRLRTTILQLRTAEADRAALQAGQAQWADEKQKLTERAGALTKQVNEDKQTAQVAENLKTQVSRQAKEIAQLKTALERATQAATVARQEAADQAKHADEVAIRFERLVVDRQEKNLALYKLATEILGRYEKFGLGDALAAREPFTGITRVKLQNLVQDYQDKFQGNRATLSQKDLAAFHDQPAAESGAGLPSQTAK